MFQNANNDNSQEPLVAPTPCSAAMLTYLRPKLIWLSLYQFYLRYFNRLAGVFRYIAFGESGKGSHGGEIEQGGALGRSSVSVDLVAWKIFLTGRVHRHRESVALSIPLNIQTRLPTDISMLDRRQRPQSRNFGKLYTCRKVSS